MRIKPIHIASGGLGHLPNYTHLWAFEFCLKNLPDKRIRGTYLTPDSGDPYYVLTTGPVGKLYHTPKRRQLKSIYSVRWLSQGKFREQAYRVKNRSALRQLAEALKENE